MSNAYELADKYAIVTGGAKSIGRAIAELFLANGCDVCIWDANRAEVPGARSALVDITRSDDISRALAALGKDQRIDILVNCAGELGRTTNFKDHDQKDWRRIIDVNLAGTKALSREIAGENVFVNCVAPGPIDTDMIRNLGPEVGDRMIQDSPMGRLGCRDEVAHLVAWLCTEASRFNTGAVFDMSGGRARY